MSPPTLIIKNLYLGDYGNASNLFHPLMKELNISHIINCCKGGQNFFPKYFNYVNLEWVDNTSQNIFLEDVSFFSVLDYIENALNGDEVVFVHCGAGISRSATVIIAFLMKKFNWSYDEAFLFVKTKKPNIQPNIHFENQLRKVEFS
jgi:protein phosphatase slingshot